MKLRSALLAATVLAAPVAAMAQPVSGLYVGAGAGYDYQFHTKIKSGSIGNTVGATTGVGIVGGHLEGPGGFVGLASVGYGFGNGLRAEIEGNYRGDHLRVKHAVSANGSAGGGNQTLSGGTNLQTYGVMVNALYDLDFGFPVVPYVGAGVGYEFEQPNSGSVYSAATGSNQLNLKTDSKSGLGVQGIVGVAYNIPAIPGLAVTAEGRYFDVVTSPRFKGTVSSGVAAGQGGNVKIDNAQHVSGLIGIRYAFNAAPPPPPPAPAVVAPPPVAPTRTYLVFFDWDRADLTARARQIIAEAAQNSTRVQFTRIEVSGHADRSGTPAYNQRLSQRRAEAVAAELVRDGVARNVIDIHAYGDTRPLVPTAAGVREPQNRRVEIAIQ